MANSLTNTENVLFILDGDKKREHRDPNNIPPCEDANLSEIIKEQTGCIIKIPHEKGNEKDKIVKQRAFLKYYMDHVFYFPVNDPEEILWKYADDSEGIIEKDIKICFCKLCNKKFGDIQSEHIYAIEEMCAHKMNTLLDDECKELFKNIESFMY